MTSGIPQPKYSGDTPGREALWFAYFQNARMAIRSLKPNWEHPQYSQHHDPKLEANKELMAAIQAVVFAAFALEYRMKRVLEDRGYGGDTHEWTFNDLITRGWTELQKLPQRDGVAKCKKPPEWDQLDLAALQWIRNRIGHGNHDKVIHKLGVKPLEAACPYFNTAVDAIKLLNWGTGYTNPDSQRPDYWDCLKLNP